MIDKSKENFNYIYHKTYDVFALQNYVSNFSTEWFLDTSRQRADAPIGTPVDTHAHSQTINYFVYDFSASWREGEPYNLTLRTSDQGLLNLINPIIEDLQTILNGKVGKVILINLPAGKEVLSHVDYGDYFHAVRRCHIAISTNPSATSTVNGETANFRLGECIELNNGFEHSAINQGTTPRIHMLVDILPKRYVV